jgi:hypothetical protein
VWIPSRCTAHGRIRPGRRDDVGCRVGRAGTLVTVIDADMGVR